MTCVRGALGHMGTGLSYTLVRMSSVQDRVPLTDVRGGGGE